jgi:hypothetical protein
MNGAMSNLGPILYAAAVGIPLVTGGVLTFGLIESSRERKQANRGRQRAPDRTGRDRHRV